MLDLVLGRGGGECRSMSHCGEGDGGDGGEGGFE
jgi:hypothetical protein